MGLGRLLESLTSSFGSRPLFNFLLHFIVVSAPRDSRLLQVDERAKDDRIETTQEEQSTQRGRLGLTDTFQPALVGTHERQVLHQVSLSFTSHRAM
jgi:hypothetical protein